MDLLPQRLIRRAQNAELPMGAFPAIAELRAHLDECERIAIESARKRGASWASIAEALGVTRQALQQRIARTQAKPAKKPRKA